MLLIGLRPLRSLSLEWREVPVILFNRPRILVPQRPRFSGMRSSPLRRLFLLLLELKVIELHFFGGHFVSILGG